jgi:hypothetical protein
MGRVGRVGGSRVALELVGHARRADQRGRCRTLPYLPYLRDLPDLLEPQPQTDTGLHAAGFHRSLVAIGQRQIDGRL